MPAYYQRNKARMDAVSRVAKDRMRGRNLAFIVEYKSSHGCVDCGESDHRVLDFDHRDEKTKSLKIGHQLRQVGIDKIKAEIAKCDVRCANCHRRRHYKGGVNQPQS